MGVVHDTENIMPPYGNTGDTRGGPSMHREMGVAPRYEEHHAPASGHTGHTGPVYEQNIHTEGTCQ